MPKSVLRILRGDREIHASLSELQALTGAAYAPFLHFCDPKPLRVPKQPTREEVWLGQYFRSELLSSALPPVSLRWISDRIGWGVFAERDLKPMEFIAEYAGIVRPRRSSDRGNAYCFEYFPSPYVIDAAEQGSLSRYINHSETPNLQPARVILDNVWHIILYTATCIPKNQELCYHYGPDYWKYRRIGSG